MKMNLISKLPPRCLRCYDWLARVITWFQRGRCPLHAAGLTYYSMLAIVPILCVIIAAAQLVGLDDLAKDRVDGYLDTLITNVERGQDDNILKSLPIESEIEREEKRVAAGFIARQARWVTKTVFEKVKAFNVRTFGLVGCGCLFWMIISSLSMVELSFNEIWGVTRRRSLIHRCWMYLLMALSFPVFVALAMSPQLLALAKKFVGAVFGSTKVTAWVNGGFVALVDSAVFRFALSFALAGLVFAVIFVTMPNRRVSFRNAFRGGLLTAILFCGWLKLCAIAQVGIARSSVLYGSFAFIPILLAWMYVGWQIVLIGACVVRSFEEPLPAEK